jgi:glutamine---fructose-6-phosphate transaminase (isomerizing)
VLANLALFIGRRKFMSQEQCQHLIDGLCAIPDQITRVLGQRQLVKEIAYSFCEREFATARVPRGSGARMQRR